MLDRAQRLHRQFFTHAAVAWEPPVDIIEAGDALLVQVALPGVAADTITVALDPGGIIVSALRPFAGGNAWGKWLAAAGVADRVEADRGPHFSSNILSLEAASQKLGVALALRPLVDADIASRRLCAPFDVEVKPQSAYYLVCPEVIADRPAVAAFRKWLLGQAPKA